MLRNKPSQISGHNQSKRGQGVNLMSNKYLTLTLHNTMWQEIILVLTLENRLLYKWMNDAKERLPMIYKSACVRHGSEKPKWKLTECVNCYKQKIVSVVNISISKRDIQPELLNCENVVSEKVKSGVNRFIHKPRHNNIMTADLLTNRCTTDV